MSISSVKQRSGRTDFDAVTALGTIQPTTVSADHRVRPTITGFDRVFTHPLIADARATFAQNAALRIVRDHGRQIFFGLRVFLFDKTFFKVAPVEGQLLQFALA